MNFPMADKNKQVACLLCDKKVKLIENGVICSGLCQQHFHYECLKIDKNKIKLLKRNYEDWKCNNCEAQPQQSADDQSSVMGKLDLLLAKVTKLELLVNRVDNLETRMNEVEESIKFLHEDYDERQKQEGGVVPMEEVKTDINEMKVKMNYWEQQNMDDQFVLDGVPEPQGKEDLKLAVLMVCNAAKVDQDGEDLIQRQDIVSVMRMRNKNVNPKQSKWAPIHVKVKTRGLPAEIMKAKKTSVPMLYPKMLGWPDVGKQIYINPMLTKENKDLLVYARLKLKTREESSYKFVWFKDGKVLARRNLEDRVTWCRDRKDVDKLVR
jgi:hypothetical protein